jgi:hypothetical protein
MIFSSTTYGTLDSSTMEFLTGDPAQTSGQHDFQTYRDTVTIPDCSRVTDPSLSNHRAQAPCGRPMLATVGGKTPSVRLDAGGFTS